jgi:intracellular sulfur oxidation DsrE/DsrF family protein
LPYATHCNNLNSAIRGKLNNNKNYASRLWGFLKLKREDNAKNNNSPVSLMVAALPFCTHINTFTYITFTTLTTFWRQTMLNFSRSFFLVMTSLFMMLTAAPAMSAGEASFADFKYVLHVDDLAPAKMELALNNATNLLQAYPPGAVEVEIVAYNIGLRMLFKDSIYSERIDSLSQSGVKFSACGVTLKGMTKQLGYTPELNPVAKVVPGGIVRIGELVRSGYVYVKP